MTGLDSTRSTGMGKDRGSRDSQAGEVVFYRTHDHTLIERILRVDSFDAPIPYLSDAQLRRAVRDFLAPSPDVYFLVAELGRDYAGFLLAHMLGPTLWRKFARDQFPKHPIGIAWLTIRLKVVRPLRWKINRWLARPRGSSAATRRQTNSVSSVPKIDRPFAWSSARPDIGQLDQIFVRNAFRGQDIAPRLLEQLKFEMAGRHVTLVEAHIDAGNHASLRAFLKAGWEACETSGGDYYVSWRPSLEYRRE